ncbi:NrsF family protein, partial [Bradyrhizobium sp. NBAIM08]|uniref:NrsF family protein n=1 Tax=Bradyrhizobium sp. NBAIM08 TaxID=2793815 RepID=UPI001CD3E239
NLIEALVVDRITAARPMGSALVGALVLGGLVSLAVFLIDLGVRADIVEALTTWRFDLKVGMVLAALGVASSLCITLSRPLSSGHPGRRLLALATLALVAVAIELASLPSASWGTRLVGSNALICLVAIPTLALAPLVTVLMVLRAAA